MNTDALTLARIQFAFTISVHIIFPALTIGLASYLAVLEVAWLRTRQRLYQDLYHFWIKVFALNFGMGVVSGVVMAYQFGTNWSPFSNFAGSVTGPLLTYEVLSAFFLEAGFLGVMLFGWSKVGPGLHLLSTLMVAAGSLVSATWIVASNSWMHTPAGYKIIDGRVVPVDWLAVILNPSFPFRMAHMAIAAFLATALIVGATSAWHLLRGNDNPQIRKMLAMSMGMILVVAPIQAWVGDAHGLNTLKFQPAKLAAIEGHWANEPGKGMPLTLFGIPDMKREETRFSLDIPRLGSLLLTHSLDGTIRGLKSFPVEDRPNSTVVFFTFRLMVGLGFLMIFLGLCAAVARWRDRLYTSRSLHRFALGMGSAGLLAMLAGWYTTEVGRQPWVVNGLMRTADAVTPHGKFDLALTLGLFVVVYCFVFGTGVFYMLRLLRQGPMPDAGASASDAAHEQSPRAGQAFPALSGREAYASGGPPARL